MDYFWMALGEAVILFAFFGGVALFVWVCDKGDR